MSALITKQINFLSKRLPFIACGDVKAITVMSLVLKKIISIETVYRNDNIIGLNIFYNEPLIRDTIGDNNRKIIIGK